MMSQEERCHHEQHGPGEQGRRPSSFRLHDPQRVFDTLKFESGDIFLDLGCGPGDYSMAVAGIVGNSGLVYAVDKSSMMVACLTEKAAAEGLENIKAMVSDITEKIPVEDNSIDICLLATVFHVPEVAQGARRLFEEIRRVLKPFGILALIECKKESGSFGPPLHMRWSPKEIEAVLAGEQLQKIRLTDLGNTYLLEFVNVK
ncbi:MAG TPA: methyltransferase domain-containing protein [Geobacteraceae bacterium]|nr:methyltransferase domain-containing protein [Geobacteraceae bacterium]